MRPSRPVLQWWLRPSVWLWVGAGALVVGAGFAIYTAFRLPLAAAPVLGAAGLPASVAIVVRVHRRARDGAGTEAEFEALLRDYLPFAAPTTCDALRDRFRAAAHVDNS